MNYGYSVADMVDNFGSIKKQIIWFIYFITLTSEAIHFQILL